MKSSARARLILAAALLLTLGAKAIWTREAPPLDADLFAARAEAVLHAQGLATTRLVRPFGTMVFGRSAGCILMVGEYTPYGTYAEVFESYGRPIGQMRYFWHGELTSEAPKLVPLAEFYAWRELRRIGFSPPRHLILAIAANPGCMLDRIGWNSVATLPR